jgi:hypothetical protein
MRLPKPSQTWLAALRVGLGRSDVAADEPPLRRPEALSIRRENGTFGRADPFGSPNLTVRF